MRLVFAILTMLVSATASFAGTRIKDITNVKGIRSNQIVGYGLVIGLNGTGDSLRNAPFTQQSVQAMLDKMGVNIRGGQARTRNVAAVIVTAELPAFSTKGSRIDVSVSSIGDAKSLAGGTLVLTSLGGADEIIYAVAQGQVVVSGLAAGGAAETVTQGVPTSGRIANGAVVERDAPGSFEEDARPELELRNPDFRTAVRITDAINRYARSKYGMNAAKEKDARSVVLRQPQRISMARLLAELGDLAIEPDQPARIVIDERSGTIVIGKDVTVSTVAVAQGSITVKVTNEMSVSQPAPFSEGQTVVVPETVVTLDEAGGNVAIVNGTTLQVLVSALNRMGLKPQGIIAVVQAIKSAGALQAELVVQ
ncbi:MAG: flagellar basal body P-ring protein FlgI [Hyphomicrobium sp.]